MSYHIHCRVSGGGPLRVLLLHALTGGSDAADRPGVKGWWAAQLGEGAPLGPEAATVWCPNLVGSCYGSSGPDDQVDFPVLSTRDQAEALRQWIEAEGLVFDLLLGVSLGGMVALELALLVPGRFGKIAVVGCGARADAWLWGTNEVQRAILRSPSLPDDEAIALARRAAMLSFRTPESIHARFREAEEIRTWLAFHGGALAARFTRKSYLALLDAMDLHDLGRDRGGIMSALRGLRVPLDILGMDPDLLFPRYAVEELAEAAKEAGVSVRLEWIVGPHGHDAFLIDHGRVAEWLHQVVKELPCAS